jgi:hypothetical protein
MGFKPKQLAVIAGISLLVSVIVVAASNNIDAVEDTIG